MPARPRLDENIPPVRLPRKDAIVLRRMAREDYGGSMSELIRDLIRSGLADRARRAQDFDAAPAQPVGTTP